MSRRPESAFAEMHVDGGVTTNVLIVPEVQRCYRGHTAVLRSTCGRKSIS